MAMRRFEGLQRKLKRDPTLREHLNNQIDDYLTKGYIRKLTATEQEQIHPRTWYLPIFPVVNPNKPEKIRMVWDAAAQVNGVSLNSMLLKGPDQLTSLVGVLYRFRERPIAISGDIREMFHQVLVKEEDQNAQRFFWIHDDSQSEPDAYVMKVMTFGATCSPSSAQHVKNINALEFKETYARAVKSITENHYVDDMLDSVDNELEAVQLANEAKMIHRHGGFEIYKWISNSSEVVKQLSEDPTINRNCLINMCASDKTSKVLGMWWCTSTDSLKYVISQNKSNDDIFAPNHTPTKRELLRILMSIFDPLGLIANFLIYLKILLQDLWRTSVEGKVIGWDDQISEEQFKRWRQWVKLLNALEQLTIPRTYLLGFKFTESSTNELHVFVDASDKAFAAVAYFRVTEGNKVECRLVAAKTRVAPLKLTSIPRLELEAARLGSRLAANIIESHSIKINRTVFWSDSKTVLCWLRSDHRRYRQFVAFRVSEILENTKIKDWRYVPTKLNIADEGTKWQRTPTFDSSSRWFTGPPFLLNAEAEWPIDININSTTDEEIKTHLFITSKEVNLTDVKRFSKWRRLLRTQVFIFRFIFNTRAKQSGLKKRNEYISKDEYQDAQEYLYCLAQSDACADEIVALKGGQGQASQNELKMKSKIFKLTPYLDKKNVLRVFGRIDAAVNVSSEVKRPILLPSDHYITELIIKDLHERFHHLNNETVVSELRQRYWIPRVRATVKSIIKRCQQCMIRNAVPWPPMMGELPSARLSAFCRPFSYSGIDFFGPMIVAMGRRTEKRWGVLITCLTTRAVHIEVASSLSTDSCILAIKRFIARLGTPIEFRSDNGTNFHGANRELQEAIKLQSSLASEFSSPITKWIFNPPSSPHMGGSWERMIQTTKKVLKQIVPSRNPTDELLHSMMLEVERVINCHPLTYVPLESGNEEALTPNHFLLGTSDENKIDSIHTEDGVLLRKNWMKSQQYANKFFWPKGRVLETVISKDGQVRQVTIQTSTGTYTRPAVKIAVLDVGIPSKSITEIDVPGECWQYCQQHQIQ